MKCQSLLSGKNKTNVIDLSSAEFVQREVKVIMSHHHVKMCLLDISGQKRPRSID